MSVTHRLTGYDRRTEALAIAHETPCAGASLARDAAGVPQQDADAVGAYPLRPDQARRIALAIGARTDTEGYDWLLEPVAVAVT